MKKAKKILSVFILVLLFGAGELWGQIITINITAEITQVDDYGDLLEGQINVGDIITGSYTYDSATPDSNPLSTVGVYQHSTSPYGYGISLSTGGFIFQTDPDNVGFLMTTLNNHNGKDMYYLQSYNNLPLSNGLLVDQIGWQLDDYSRTALSSDALPTTLPVLEDWPDSFGMHISLGIDKPEAGIYADVTSVALVPEPGTVLLLGLGGIVLRKRK